MELKVKNAAGEMRAIDIDASDTAIINGAQGPTTSLLDWLTADERRELDEWCNNQTPSPNGAIAMNAWPGWHDVALQRFADTARNYKPNIQTVTQSFAGPFPSEMQQAFKPRRLNLFCCISLGNGPFKGEVQHAAG